MNEKCKSCIYIKNNRCPIKEKGDYKDIKDCKYD